MSKKVKLPKIIQQLFLLTKNSALGSAASFALTIALANYFGPTEFGIYTYVILIGTIFTIILTFSTDTMAPVIFAKSKKEASVFNTTYSIRLIFVFILILSTPFLLMHSLLLFLGVLALSIQTLNLSFMYEINNSNVKYSYIYLIERLSYAAIVALFLFLDHITLELVFLVLLSISILSLTFQLSKNKKYVKNFIFLNTKDLLSNLQNNLLLVVITFSTFVYTGFSRLIIEDRFGLEALGIYSAGWQLIMAVIIFQSQVTRIWRLKISTSIIDNNKLEFLQNLKTYFYFATIPVMLFALVINIFSDELVNLLFGVKYGSLTNLLPIFTIYFIILNIDSLTKIFWTTKDNKKEFLLINLSFTFLLIAVLYMVPKNTSLVVVASIIISTHACSIFLLSTRFLVNYLKKSI